MPDNTYENEHELELRQLLHRLGLWGSSDEQLPPPSGQATGAGELSRVYFIYLPGRCNTKGRYIIAKFDESERQRVEWRALTDLSKIDTPQEMLQPISGNRPGDAAIVLSAVHGIVGHLRCESLQSLLTAQIKQNPSNCVAALEKVFEVLEAFYSGEPGHADFASQGQIVVWKSYFGSLIKNKRALKHKLQQVAHSHWPEVDWCQDADFRLPSYVGSDTRLPNPFLSLEERVKRAAGRVMLSRIHGDLNLGNVLVAMEADRSVSRAFVIDFTNCHPNRVTAVDFARMECEIWRRVLPRVGGTEAEILRYFIQIRECLDGRQQTLDSHCPEVKGFGIVVYGLRKIAARLLNPELRTGGIYLLEDYFYCLYFISISLLKHKDVSENPLVSRILLISAAQALQFLHDIESGAFIGANWDSVLNNPPRDVILSEGVACAGKTTEPRSQSVPPAREVVTGRDCDVAELRRRLTCEKGRQRPVVIVRGWPGVGKTTVAKLLGNDTALSKEFTDAILWVELGKEADPVTQLVRCCECLGIDVSTVEPDLVTMIKLVRDRLVGRRALIIVDDVWTADQGLPFREVLGPGCAALFTTRFPNVSRRLETCPGRDEYLLQVLDIPNSVELLRTLIPNVVERCPDEMESIADHLEGLPLALQVAGRLIAEEDRLGLSIQSLLDELRDNHKILEEKAPDDRFDYELGTTPTIRLLFERTTNRLEEPDRERFALLGVWAAAPAIVHIDWMCDLWNTNGARQTIRRFADLGLVEPLGDGAFQIHALLVAHAKSLLEA